MRIIRLRGKLFEDRNQEIQKLRPTYKRSRPKMVNSIQKIKTKFSPYRQKTKTKFSPYIAQYPTSSPNSHPHKIQNPTYIHKQARSFQNPHPSSFEATDYKTNVGIVGIRKDILEINTIGRDEARFGNIGEDMWDRGTRRDLDWEMRWDLRWESMDG